MTNRPFQQEARAFLIWRAAKPVNWECSYSDIARATGISYSAVHKICRQRGWVCKFQDELDTKLHISGETLNYGKDAVTFMQERLDRRSSHL